MTWGQMQVLADLVKAGVRGQRVPRNLEPETQAENEHGDCSDSSVATTSSTTSGSLQALLLNLKHMELDPDVFSDNLAQLGYSGFLGWKWKASGVGAAILWMYPSLVRVAGAIGMVW